MTTIYNVNIIGGLNNNNGVLSGFSSSNYAQLPNNFNPETNDFEIIFKINTGTLTNSITCFYQIGTYITDSIAVGLENKQLWAEVAYNDNQVFAINGTTTLSNNTDYYISFGYTNGVYTLKLSTDRVTWSTEGTYSSNFTIPDGIRTYNIGVDENTDFAFTGSIDLNESYIDINNIRWWQGATSVSDVRTRIQLRHDTAANWASVNPILLVGEVGIETDTLKQKVGDGSTAWNSLAYRNEIFIAEYNVTSWNDIVSAYNSGKTIICKYLQEGGSSDIVNYPQYSLNYSMQVRKNTGNLILITFYFELYSISVNSTNWSISSDSILRETVQNDTEYISPYSQYFGVLSTDDYTTVYNLIDTTTGLIPDARISSNIARTSAIPTVPTNISAFTNDSGYITGITSSNVTTALGYTPSDNTLSNVSSIDSGSAVATALSGKANTDLSNLSSTGKTVLDGQWITANDTSIINAVSINASSETNYSLSSVLPNDGYKYEMLIDGVIEGTSTLGQAGNLQIKTDLTPYIRLASTYCWVSGKSAYGTGSTVIPVGSERKIYLNRATAWHGTATVRLKAYRRIGTNS